MKVFLLIAFCFGVKADVFQVGLTVSRGVEMQRKVIGTIENNSDENTKTRVSKFAQKYGIELVDNEDQVRDASNFIYPCPDLEDLDCIRQFMAKHSDCKPTNGPVPDPIVLQQNTIFFPSSNMTLVHSDLEVQGLNKTKVVSFYYNIKTRYLIFAIQIPNIIEISPKVYFVYRIPGQEPIIKSTYVYAKYSALTFTAAIPTVSTEAKLRLDFADISADVGKRYPEFCIESGASNTTDSTVNDLYENFIKVPTAVIRETFLFQSQLFTSIYIQSNICDFGLEIYSV